MTGVYGNLDTISKKKKTQFLTGILQNINHEAGNTCMYILQFDVLIFGKNKIIVYKIK